MHWLRPIDGGIWKVLLVSAAMLLPLSGGIIKAITHITLLFSEQIFGQFSPNPFIFFTFRPPIFSWHINQFKRFPPISAPLLSPSKSPHKRKKDPRLFALSLFLRPVLSGRFGLFFAGGLQKLSSPLEKPTHSAKQSWHKLIIGNAVNCDRLMAGFERFCSFLLPCFYHHRRRRQGIRSYDFVTFLLYLSIPGGFTPLFRRLETIVPIWRKPQFRFNGNRSFFPYNVFMRRLT